MTTTLACEDCRNKDNHSDDALPTPEQQYCPAHCTSDIKPAGQFHVHIKANHGSVIFCQGHGGEQSITTGGCFQAAKAATTPPKKPKVQNSQKNEETSTGTKESQEQKWTNEEREQAFAEFRHFVERYWELFSEQSL
jgi:nitrite reductase/ring-hydroxylating ferredoxin subunit